MRTLRRNLLCLTVLTLTLPPATLRAEGPETISLPAPQTQGGKPLMEALKERRTTRDFKPDKLPPQLLANLLWAGFGINRPDTGHRTAPSAMNAQDIDLYAALPEGLFLYDAKANQLRTLSAQDLRSRSNGQPFFKNAPLVLIYVADLSRFTRAQDQMRPVYADFDAGCISQNVYLYCASAGLATVVFDLDRPPLAAAMKLKPEQRIVMAQAVGFPSQSGPR